MKQTGIARKLDKLGRIVVPIEARRSLGWKDTTPIEFSLFGRYILLREYGDNRDAPVAPGQGTPIFSEVNKALNHLTEKDALMVLDLLYRLTRGSR